MYLILAAIIAGIFGVGSLLLKDWLERSRSTPASDLSVRRKALCGVWTGVGWDGPRRGKPRFKIMWHLFVDVLTQEVRGQSTITYPGEAPEAFELSGGFLYENYCRLLYQTLEEGAVRLGAVTIQLGMKPDRLAGAFAGASYRNPREPLGSGWVELEKSQAHS